MSNQSLPNYLTVKQFTEKHNAFTEGGIRSLIFNAGGKGSDPHGFSSCIRRIGKKVLIDEHRFFEVLERQPEHSVKQ